MNKQLKLFAVIGVISCLLSVVFGAFGAHALKSLLSESAMRVYQTAVTYQTFHGLALIALATLFSNADGKGKGWRWIRASGYFFVFGLLLFCGSLYALALTEIKILGAITPLGGLAFILAWAFMLTALIFIPTKQPSSTTTRDTDN